MCAIGLISVECSKYQFNSRYEKCNFSKKYRYYYDNEVKIIDYCERESIKEFVPKNHPDRNIQIYDGHIETADLKPLEKADFVFLNVSNMSHGMYYRVMKLLREKNIPFDYLGRTVNQELYEKEMADILIKHRQRMV